MSIENFVALLESRAEQYPDKLVYTFIEPGKANQTITYAELCARAHGIAAQLSTLKGKSAILVYPPGFDFIAALLGCFYAGVIAVPSYPPVSKHTALRLRNIIADSHANALLTNEATYKKLSTLVLMQTVSSEAECRILQDNHPILPDTWHWICTDEISGANGGGLIMPKPHDIAFIQYTSGSTSGIKGVKVSHKNLYSNSLLTQHSMDLRSDDILINWLPQYHDMGLIGGLLQALVANFEDILISPFEFVKNPQIWLRLITDYQATLSGGPNFAYELCTRYIPESALQGFNLSSWRVAFNGAEPISSKTISDFTNRFQACGFKKESFYCCYGLAEATLFVAGNFLNEDRAELEISKEDLAFGHIKAADDSQPKEKLVSSGKINSEIDVLIVNPQSLSPEPEDTIGEIWVRGPSVSAGYFGEDKQEINQAVFDAHTTQNQENFLRTGDLGFIHQGHLFVTGRIKDLIIIHGKNYYPHLIEEAASSHPALRVGCTVAFSMLEEGVEKLVLLTEMKPGKEQAFETIAMEIGQQVVEACGVVIDYIHLVRPHTILKTSSGKLQRQACKEALLKEKFSISHTWHNPCNLYADTEESERATAHSLVQTLKASSQSTEKNQLVDNLIIWLRDYAATRINSFVMDERRCIPPHIVLHFAQKGLFGLQIPPAQGGLGLGMAQTLRLLEQLSAINLSLGVFVGLANANIYPLFHHACARLRDTYVPLLASGRELAAFALTEPQAGSDLHQIETRAELLENGVWSLSGVKCWSGSAAWSGIMTVFAKAYDKNHHPLGLTAFAVLSHWPGVRQGPESMTMGLKAMVQNTVYFDKVLIPSDYLLGQAGHGLKISEDALMNARLGITALCLGAMKRCAQIATQFSKNRVIATGVLLDNPLCIHNLLEIHHAITGVQALLNHSIRFMDNQGFIPVELALINKVMSTELLWMVIDKAMQILGGRGYIETNGLAQMMRDARVMRIFEGTSEVIFDYIGTLVLNDPASFFNCLKGVTGCETLRQELLSSLEQAKAYRDKKGLDSHQLPLLKYKTGTLTANALMHALLVSQAEPASCLSWSLRRSEEEMNGFKRLISHPFTAQCLPSTEMPYTDAIGWVEETSPGSVDQTADPLLLKSTVKDMPTNPPRQVHEEKTSSPGEVQDEALVTWLGHWFYSKHLIKTSSISLDTSFKQLALDSIIAVALVGDLEKTLNRSLPIDLVYECKTVGDLVGYLQPASQKIAGAQPLKRYSQELTMAMVKPWLSEFLDRGYDKESLQVEHITISPGFAEGRLQVNAYFTPSDGEFHLNIFNGKLALLQIFSSYIRVMAPPTSIENIGLQSLSQRYIKPIRNPQDILLRMAVDKVEHAHQYSAYHVRFVIGDEYFTGNAVFRVHRQTNQTPDLNHMPGEKPLRLTRQLVNEAIPTWLHNIYENHRYKFKKIYLEDNTITAQVKVLIHEATSPCRSLTEQFLANIYASQLGVIFACWDSGLSKKNGEFYVMKLAENQLKTDCTWEHREVNTVELTLKNKISNFNRTVYTLIFKVNDVLAGEVVFAIPLIGESDGEVVAAD